MISIKVSCLTSTLLFVINNLSFSQDLWPIKTNINDVIALADCEEWTEVKNNGHLKFNSRWLAFGDTLKTRQITLEFTTTSNRCQIIQLFNDPIHLLKWNDGIRNADILMGNDSTSIVHITYDIPYPFAQQDLVLKNNIHENKNQDYTVSICAMPDFIQTVPDVNRQRNYFAQWQIKKNKGNEVKVYFTAISFAKSKIPRWIRDPILQYKLFKSFETLRKMTLQN